MYLENKFHILPLKTKSETPIDLFLPPIIILSITACLINQDNAAIAPIVANKEIGSTTGSQHWGPDHVKLNKKKYFYKKMNKDNK